MQVSDRVSSMVKTLRTLAFAVVVATTVSTYGQQQGGPSALPQPGELLPEVEVYDAEGRPFSMSELGGQYSVLVFGCLT